MLLADEREGSDVEARRQMHVFRDASGTEREKSRRWLCLEELRDRWDKVSKKHG